MQEQIERTVGDIRFRYERGAVLRASALLDSKLTGLRKRIIRYIHTVILGDCHEDKFRSDSVF